MSGRIGSLVAALESKSAQPGNDTKSTPPKRSFSTTKVRSPSLASAALPAVADDLAATIKAAIDEQVTTKLRDLALQNERLEEELQNTRIENENLRRRQLDFEAKLKDLSDSPASGKKTDGKPTAQLLFNIKKCIREQVFPQLGDLFHHCARLQEQREQTDGKQRKLEKRFNSFVQQTSTQLQCLELAMQELQQEQIHDRAFERFGAKLDGGEQLPPAFGSVKKFRRLGVVYDTDFALGKLRSNLSGSRVDILEAIRRTGKRLEEGEEEQKKMGWDQKLREKSRRLQAKIGEMERFVLRWGEEEEEKGREKRRGEKRCDFRCI